MNETTLKTALERLLADLFTVYLEAHGAHWNVEGPLFPMLHEFFEGFYTDIYGSIDTFAESLRQHQFTAPVAFAPMLKAGSITAPATPTLNGATALASLYQKNQQLMDSLKKVSAAAAGVDDQGLQNFTQERLFKHLKWDWQLRSQLKRVS